MPEMSVLEDTEPSRTRHIVKTVRSDSTPPVAKKKGGQPFGDQGSLQGQSQLTEAHERETHSCLLGQGSFWLDAHSPLFIGC